VHPTTTNDIATSDVFDKESSVNATVVASSEGVNFQVHNMGKPKDVIELSREDKEGETRVRMALECRTLARRSLVSAEQRATNVE
jgi:hypothetical protein